MIKESIKLKGHVVNPGRTEGEAIVYNGQFSFIGDMDVKTGQITVPGHPLQGQTLANKVFVFNTGSGSTGGPFYAFHAKKRNTAPAAMVCVFAEPLIASAAITANIPMVDQLSKNPLEVIKNGDYVLVDATEGIVEIFPRKPKAPRMKA